MKRKPFYLKYQLLYQKTCFWTILILTTAVLLIFPLERKYFHEIHSLPFPEDGVLDMKEMPLSDNRSLSLEGTWEFYWNKWIVTDSLEDAVSDAIVPVPSVWSRYDFGGAPLPDSGYASYRLLLTNCPENTVVNCYIPSLGAAYRVFLNGQLIARSGTPRKDAQNTQITLSLDQNPFLPPLTPESELVIEVSACHNGGFYTNPVLLNSSSAFHGIKLYTILISMCAGILILILFCSFYVLSLKDLTFQIWLMFFMTLIILLRMMGKDEMYGVLLLIIPSFKHHTTLSILRLITFFLPAAFIFWTQDTTKIELNRKFLRYTVLFDAFFCAPLLWLLFKGYFVYHSWLYALCLSPYTLMLPHLYRNIKRGVPYSLTVSVSFMLIISSLIMANMYSRGLISPIMTLYAPACLVFALFLQASIHFRKDKEMRIQALETVSLKLSLQEKEMALMLSQIKPHFLYNALIAIQVLCIKNPVEASDAIGRFSLFLRANMRAISSAEPVPFEQELRHIENYVAIEKLRFNERLNVVYDIQVEDFKVPVLTLQPFLENAIKHGVCQKITGGTVTLHTHEENDFIYIEIVDDGVGFDTQTLESSSGYGIKNITFRLKEKVGAKVDIQSFPDEGTTVRISLPKGGNIS